MVEVSLPGGLRGTANVPGSKPHGQRAVVLASLGYGTSTLHNVNLCAETRLLLDACCAMGAAAEVSGARLRITGVSGHPRQPGKVLNAAGSAFAARVLLAVSSLGDGPAIFAGSQRLAQRPLAPLVSLLRALGARLDLICPPAPLPVVSWGGGLEGGTVTPPMTDTSQFASALLLVAPYARKPVTLLLDPCGVGRQYVTATLAMMEYFGATLAVGPAGAAGGAAVGRAGAAGEQPHQVSVCPGGYTAREISIGPDATALFCLIAAAVGAQAEFSVTGSDGDSVPDGGLVTGRGWSCEPLLAAAIDIGGRLGVQVTETAIGLHISGWRPPRGPVHVNAADVPTFVPALAAVAGRLPCGLRVTGARHLQFHKTDRLALLLAELGKLGQGFTPVLRAGELDGFETAAPGIVIARELDSHGDHRLFMALVLAALASPRPVIVHGAQTLATSFPDFLQCLAGLGASVQPSSAREAYVAAGS